MSFHLSDLQVSATIEDKSDTWLLKSIHSVLQAVVLKGCENMIYRWLADRRTCREGASHSSGSRATLSLASFLSRSFCCCLCSHVRPELVSALLSDRRGSLVLVVSCHPTLLLDRHVPFSGAVFVALLGGRSIHSASPFSHLFTYLCVIIFVWYYLGYRYIDKQ